MNALKKISQFLSRYTSFVVIAVAAVTFFFPELFQWINKQLLPSFSVQSLVLGIIMLGMGLTLSVDDFKILAKRPLDIFIGAAAQYTIMPLIAWLVATVLHLPAEIKVGLILVGCCPGGVSSNIMSFLCKGDVPFSVGMTTASTLLSPVMTPLLVLWLAGESIDVTFFSMFLSIVQVVIVPIAIGFFINYFFGKTKAYREIQAVAPGVSVLGLACIVGGVITSNGASFFTSGITIFIAVFLHNGLGYLLGFLVGKATGMNLAKRKTIAIEVGMQNAGLATNLSRTHFPTMPDAALASAVSCVWHSISGTIIAGIFARFAEKNPAPSEEAAPAAKVADTSGETI